MKRKSKNTLRNLRVRMQKEPGKVADILEKRISMKSAGKTHKVDAEDLREMKEGKYNYKEEAAERKAEQKRLQMKQKTHPGFKVVASKMAEEQHESPQEAAAELAASTRNASASAKRKNPRLSRVLGKKTSKKKMKGC